MRPALIALLATLLLAPAARAQDADVARSLRSDPVYVAPEARDALSAADERKLESVVDHDARGPLYVAVLPASAGSASAVGRKLAGELGTGAFAIVVGRRFIGGATAGAGLDQGVAPALAGQAFRAHRSEGLAATLEDYVRRVGEARANGGRDAGGGDGGGGSPAGLLVLIGVLGGGFALFSTAQRRRRRRAEAERLAALRRTADEDRAALGEDIRALDLDVEMPGADPAAKADYGRAVDAHVRAGELLSAARAPADFEAAAQQLEEGRWAMESA